MRLPLSFRLHPSRATVVALLAIHGLAVTAIAVSHFALAAQIALLALIALSLAHKLRVFALRSARWAVVSLRLCEGDILELEYGDGHHVATRIDLSSTVSNWLIALRLRHENRRLWLTLLPDAMDREEFRQLQIWLRCRAAAGVKN